MPIEYIHAMIGGLLIGLSAILLMTMLGRIAGISGLLWQSVQSFKPNTGLLFITGLIVGPLLVQHLFNWEVPAPSSSSSIWIVISGLLVGFGTRLGSGCTSGHGICGISRLSARSIVATCTFMLAGIITVAVRNLFN